MVSLAPQISRILFSQNSPAAVMKMEATISSTAVLPSTCSASAFFPSPSRMEIRAVPPMPISMPKASTTSMKGNDTVMPAMPSAPRA